MIKLGMKIVQRPPTAERLMKYINLGIATGLTKTATEGQAAVISSLKGTFTLRNQWFQPTTPLGIKRTMARAENLRAEIKTSAAFLEQHEKGAVKTARGHRVAVPLRGLRPKGSKKILRGPLRPQALLASGKAFILDTPKGEVIARLKGKGQRLEILYGLEPSVRVRKASTFYEPINKVVRANLNRNITVAIDHSLRKLSSRL